jgi:Family of unknown function (DUF6283)
MTAKPRPRPCASCPYRQGVPSGVWDAAEYAKLPDYDGDTGGQSPTAFFCHQNDGSVCSGWLGHRDPYGLLGVRIGVTTGLLDPSCLEYQTDVPLFATGAEAAAHGMKDIRHPGKRAKDTMRKITTKKERS